MNTRSRTALSAATYILLAVFTLLLLSACKGSDISDGTSEISVRSDDYPGLTVMRAGTFDAEEYRRSSLSDHPYYAKRCSVDKKDGQLIVNDGDDDSPAAYLSVQNGYFVGVDRGEFGGWVRYFFDDGKEKDEAVVFEDNYRGFIGADGERYQAFILTGGDDSWQLFAVSAGGRYGVEWHETAHGSGYANCGVYDEARDIVYVVTTGGIFEIAGDGSVREVHEFASDRMLVNSAVILDGSLYCGTNAGIYRFRISECDGYWYPMDHRKYSR